MIPYNLCTTPSKLYVRNYFPRHEKNSKIFPIKFPLRGRDSMKIQRMVRVLRHNRWISQIETYRIREIHLLW